MEPRFNEGSFQDKVSRLQPHQQLTWGACCCERMIKNYEVFAAESGWRDAGPLRKSLDAIWQACSGSTVSEESLRAMLAECEACAPSSDDSTSLYTTSAQDAAFAICSMLDFLLGGDAEKVVVAARYSMESVDLVVQELENMDSRDPALEKKILEHPLMQQELLRLRRDLEIVGHLSAGDHLALAKIRASSKEESSLLLQK